MLGSDQSLYLTLFENETNNAMRISGNFDGGCLIKPRYSDFRKTIKVCGVCQGVLDIFEVNYEKSSEYEYLKISSFDAHYDDITRVFNSEEILITTSLDSTLKIFFPRNFKNINESKVSFDRAQANLTRLYALENERLVSLCKDSNLVYFWNASNGKIMKNLEFESNEIVMECFFGKLMLIVSRKELSSSEKLLILRGYFYKCYNTNDLMLKKEFEISFSYAKDYKLVKDELKADFYYLLIEVQHKSSSSLSYHEIDCAYLKENYKTRTVEPSRVVKLDMYTKMSDNLLKDTCLTSNNKLLVLFYGSQLYYINISLAKVVFSKDLSKHDINVEYFLSPTNLTSNKLEYLTPLRSTDNLFAINNLNDLIYINFSSETARLGMSKYLKYKFNSFKLNSKYLVAFSKLASKLVGFSVDEILETNKIDKAVFKLELNGLASLDFYGFSASYEYVYTIENKKTLKLYKVDDGKCIGEVAVYSEANDALCTNDFVCLAMRDKKIISFLICDPNEKESIEKVKKLESRSKNIHDEGLRNKAMSIFKNINEFADMSSEEEEEDVDIITQLNEKNDSSALNQSEAVLKNCNFYFIFYLFNIYGQSQNYNYLFH